ncbi:MAG: tRNA preQ1(34) S-adenosylmethionine ribosyltransferase-isomerase QueA [Planctomycetes bacterium]|nr:tRNA preQ1(34) S-adenosylmethionine ribosyltransferase-isomerase QueA [Planctomycetota bacterium]
MKLSDFDYELPAERVAQRPTELRDRARLFVHERASDQSYHREMRDLAAFLRPGDLMVVNDTRVLPARLFARRASGGRIELLLLEPATSAPLAWTALVRPARRLSCGERLNLEGAPYRVHLVARASNHDGGAGMEWTVQLEAAPGVPIDPMTAMERAGHIPLPPYVQRSADGLDAARYQTVYASEPGAVAAPTAGLHFTPELLAHLAESGIERAALTLHVGPGTFQPVKCDDIEQHPMHAERYVLQAETVASVRRTRARAGRVVAVGTTAVRVLESCVGQDGELAAGRGSTRLFLHPGARFRVVDALLTNFHLPRSTLLMLVCAFAGRERVLRLYAEAIARGYRFYSYGDAMLLL